MPADRSKSRTTRALAGTKYPLPALDTDLPDQAVCSEDEIVESNVAREDDSHQVIRFSIGPEQQRLNSPTTPAVEKAAALDRAGGFFGGAFDGNASRIVEAVEEPEDSDEPDEPAEEDALGHSTESPARGPPLPSPWRAEPKQFQTPRSNKTKSVLRDGFFFGRRRASSGPENGQKSFLPSMPKNLSLNLPFSSSRTTGKEDPEPSLRNDSSARRSTLGTGNARHTRTWFDDAVRGVNRSLGQSSSELSAMKDAEDAHGTVAELPNDLGLQHVRSRPGPMLRRSTSDNSLVTTRTLSMVESLGDDTRFENVQDQVNSRFKAIKDSFQDSSIKLPSMPSISSFNVSSFTPDFMNRERSRSAFSKDVSPSPHRRQPDQPEDPMTRRPWSSARAAMHDAPIDKDHPHFKQAVDELEGDVVVLGGYRGSILRSAEPPHRQLWVPIKVGLNIRKVDLEVAFDEDGDERATEKVIPGGMLTHIGPVDISRRLFKRLRSCENAHDGRLRIHDYGYDWRLNPNHLSKRLISFLESLPCNRPGTPKYQRGATVIAHSLGGLITRHAVNQRPELFNGVIYAGVPKTCINILGPFRNGDEVLLSDRVLTAQVNFSIRTSFALLPLNGRCFFDKHTKEEYPVDFFDPQTWVEYRLSPCVARPLAPLVAPPKPSGISSYVSSVANAIPSLPLRGRKASTVKTKNPADPANAFTVGGVGGPDDTDMSNGSSQMTRSEKNVATTQPSLDSEDQPSVRTAVTIAREDALEYLTRTLASVKQFKQELIFRPEHQEANIYPPVSVIYGKSTPTVFGAKVDGREGIKHADAYDELAFASGDGVVLAKAAMVPEGYRPARGGIVSSDRGHVTLLGDLEAVGKCLGAISRARRKGVGLGESSNVAR